jgi:hypothetical protein
MGKRNSAGADPGTVALDICGDTEHVPPAALETCVRTMEAVTVAATGG